MTRLWLTSVTATAPVTIGADRMAVDAPAEWETFRRALHAVHPRLLPLFKARLLTADDDDAGCGGADGGELELAGGRPIVLAAEEGTIGLRLSACAEAFLDRLIAPAEALRLIRSAGLPEDAVLTERQKLWLGTVRMWWERGLAAMVLLED